MNNILRSYIMILSFVFYNSSNLCAAIDPPWFVSNNFSCQMPCSIPMTAFPNGAIDSFDFIGAFIDSVDINTQDTVQQCVGIISWENKDAVILISADNITTIDTLEGLLLNEPLPLKVYFKLAKYDTTNPYSQIIDLEAQWDGVGSDTLMDCMGSAKIDSFSLAPDTAGSSIYGYIYQNSMLTYDTLLSSDVYLIEESSLDTILKTNAPYTGQYLFQNVANGNYFVSAKPVSASQGSPYLPAYHSSCGNTCLINENLFWPQAKVFSVNNIDVYDVDINLGETPPIMSGNAKLSGTFKEASTNMRGPGDPLDNIIIGLINQDDGETVGVAITDNKGNFEFNNLEIGNYTLMPDVVGVQVDTSSSNTVNIVNTNDTIVFNLSFDSSGISTDPVIMSVGGNISSSNITVCEGSNVSLSLNGHVGDIQWQISTDSLSWNNLSPSDTLINYLSGSLSTTTYYRAAVTNDTSSTDYSNVLKITVLNSVINNISAAICSGNTYSFGGQNLSVAGLYNDTLTATNTCDSIVILDLSLNQLYIDSLSADICDGETYILGSQSLTGTGIFTEVFQSVNTCDSTVVLDLNVYPPVPTNVNLSGADSVFVNDTKQYNIDHGATFNWSVQGGTILSGAGTSTISVQWNNVGSDSVFVTVYDSNACLIGDYKMGVEVLMTTGIKSYNSKDLNIYPNPFSNTTIIEFNNDIKSSYSLSVYDIFGNLVRVNDNITNDKFVFQKDNISKGVYIIELSSNAQIYRGRLLIK